MRKYLIWDSLSTLGNSAVQPQRDAADLSHVPSFPSHKMHPQADATQSSKAVLSVKLHQLAATRTMTSSCFRTEILTTTQLFYTEPFQ